MEEPTSERKLASEPARELFAATWLGHVCDRDFQYAGATISSIYYDTPTLASYREKLNGDFMKSKLRLRWYDDGTTAPAETPVFLELKQRVGGRRIKTRVRLSVSGQWVTGLRLDDPRLRDLPYRTAPDFLAAIPADLHPVLTVTFERRRYTCPVSGARVSLDTDIRGTDVNPALLPAVGEPRRVPAVVVEIKGASIEEPPWLGELYRAGFRLRPFSKYAACLTRLIHGAVV